ncbi:MAG: 1-acyl-sn-glycerol-3-phosphate acyltransferase [Caulobacteraceae bacterium]|nr:1-acyl-sn-glycerol-3-phosphate acyltransferase [Caulobacteraceae bacterium]
MVLADAASPIPRPSALAAHVVDTLIEERAPKLAASPIWPLIRPPLYALLDYSKARRMADAIAGMGGREALEYCAALLALKVEARFLERIPPAGRLVVIVNHPTGVADGMAVYEALKRLRPDLLFYANSDAHRVCPGFAETLIPVEWVAAKRTRERTRLTLSRTREAMEAGRALVIFPAGRIARRRGGRTEDPAWAPTACSVARKYHAPILPVRLSGPAPVLFHLFDRMSDELRDVTLFHELLNKRGRRFELVVGPPIDPGQLPQDAAEASARLKVYIERELGNDPERAQPC